MRTDRFQNHGRTAPLDMQRPGTAFVIDRIAFGAAAGFFGRSLLLDQCHDTVEFAVNNLGRHLDVGAQRGANVFQDLVVGARRPRLAQFQQPR